MKLNNLFGNPELIKVNELKPYGNNAKHFDQSVYNDLEKSFKEFGDVGICLCDIDGTLIDGNTRLKFFKDNNIEFCYARKAIKKLAEKQVVRLNAILDNIGNKPDFSVIDVEILEEIKVDYDTVVVEIEEIKPEQLEAQEDDFDVPEGGIETDIVLGDLFEIGQHRLLCGDSTDSDQVAKLMNGEKADMVFTDPPYGIDYSGGRTQVVETKKYGKLMNDDLQGVELGDLISNVFLFNKQEADVYICVSPKMQKPFLDFIENSNKTIDAVIVWDKKQPGLGYMAYRRQCEFILFVKGGNFKKGDTSDFDLWSISRDNGQDYVHGTQKPIAVPSRAINNSSKKDDLVLDYFGGSGSTMVASHQLNRKCYGMELDSKYVEVIVQRMIKLDNTLVIKRNGIDETQKWLDKLA